MKALITESLIKEHNAEDIELRDTRCRGLVLRCRASGQHTYRLQVRRGAWLTIGRTDDFTPQQARLEADRLRGDVAHGRDPIAERRRAAASSLDRFLETDYETWATTHRQAGAETLKRVRTTFKDWLPLSLDEITVPRVDRWRTSRLADGVKPATVNRDVADIRSVLSRAVDFGILAAHPLAKLKALRVDRAGVVRFLTRDEEKRLIKALQDRDDARRAARASANAWRRDRGYPELPSMGVYSDHLHPLVALALHTGGRRGELLKLRWRDVDLDGALVTFRGDGTKSGQTRHVPLNVDIVKIMRAWRPLEVKASDWVFPGGDGERLQGLKSAFLALLKSAKIAGFRFHDLRHTFASRLVQAGVDLAVVRELLGHRDFTMTLRYAHLTAEHRTAAVAKLASAS